MGILEVDEHGWKKDRRERALRDVSMEDNGGLYMVAMDGGEALVQENSELDMSSLKVVDGTISIERTLDSYVETTITDETKRSWRQLFVYFSYEEAKR
ncbi:hypothetical protein LIER_31191 [Lithospermum erythrorhizon]|uniref:Uncharacterized protein n=1 Tax=Lithospermum erythrorhizon TaxID=34254 RepID=A0AAV3RTS4_LITER